MAKLSLAARKDIKDNEPKLQANLKAIEVRDTKSCFYKNFNLVLTTL